MDFFVLSERKQDTVYVYTYWRGLCFAVFAAILFFAVQFVAPQTALAATWTVAPDGNDFGDHPTEPYQHISAAIDRASHGDYIAIYPGTYAEQLVITKGVYLTGIGQGEVIIQAPTTLAHEPEIFFLGYPENQSLYSIIDIASGSTTISNITVNGPVALDSPGKTVAGIHVRAPERATIEDVQIHLAPTAPTTTQYTKIIGVMVGEGFGSLYTPGASNIYSTTVSGFFNTAIHVSGNGSYASIINNTITGYGALSIPQIGIGVSQGAEATIKNNTVSHIIYNNPNDPTHSSVAISVWDALNSEVIISENILQDNLAGIIVQSTEGVTLLNNHISVSSTAYNSIVPTKGIWITARPSTSVCSEGSQAGCITEATVTGNTVQGAGDGYGIVVGYGQGLGYTPASITATISNNTISGWNSGVWVGPTITSPQVEISENSFGEHTQFDIENTDTWIGNVIAENNWWGTRAGPLDEHGASGEMDSAPWYINSAKTVSTSFPVVIIGGLSVTTSGNDDTGIGTQESPYRTIGYALTQAYSGETLLVSAGTYEENIVITKPITLQGTAGATIIAGNGDGMTIQTSDVTINGFRFITSRGVVISHTAPVVRTRLEDNQFYTSSDALVADGSALVSDLEIINNTFENTVYLEYIEHLLLENNTFDPRQGLYPFGDAWSAGGPYAVRIVGSASALAQDLTIRGNEWLAGTTNETRYKIALSLNYTSDVLIENNTMTQLYNIGIPIWPIVSHVVIRNNSIEADVQAINFSNDGSVDGGTLLIENNTFTGNDYLAYPTLPDYPEAAVAFRGFTGVPTTIQGNTFSNNKVGLLITEGADSALFTIQENSFFDNSEFHIRNLSSGVVSVPANWWGTMLGLSTSFVQGEVMAVPWYLNSNRTTLSPNIEGDVVAPIITNSNPSQGEVNVDPSKTSIRIVWNEPVVVEYATITVTPDVVISDIEMSQSFDTATIEFTGALSPNTRYTVSLNGITDIANNTMPASVWAFTTARTYSVSLVQGWNFVSLPLTPSDTAIDAVLGIGREGESMTFLNTSSQFIDSVWMYDTLLNQWLVYRPQGNQALNNLTTMTAGYGYWVNYTGITVGALTGYGNTFGSMQSVPPSRLLYNGWNMIGYYQHNDTPSLQARDALSSLTPNMNNDSARWWTSLWKYDTAHQQFISVGLTDTMKSGEGYWIFMRETKVEPYTYAP